MNNPHIQAAAYRIQAGWRPEKHRFRQVLGVALVIALLSGAPEAAAQMRGGGRSSQGRGRSAGNPQTNGPVVSGSFAGTLRSVEKKRIRLDVANEQSVEFVRDHKTKFFRGDKEIPAKQVEAGDAVTVDATKEASGDLVARRITLAAPKSN